MVPQGCFPACASITALVPQMKYLHLQMESSSVQMKYFSFQIESYAELLDLRANHLAIVQNHIYSPASTNRWQTCQLCHDNHIHNVSGIIFHVSTTDVVD